MKERAEGDCDSFVVPSALHLPSARTDFLRDRAASQPRAPPLLVFGHAGAVLLTTILGESREDSSKGTQHLGKQN